MRRRPSGTPGFEYATRVSFLKHTPRIQGHCYSARVETRRARIIKGAPGVINYVVGNIVSVEDIVDSEEKRNADVLDRKSVV